VAHRHPVVNDPALSGRLSLEESQREHICWAAACAIPIWIWQCREMRLVGTSASAVSIISRNWISRKAIPLVLPQATRFVDDFGFRLVANIRNLCALGAAGRGVDLVNLEPSAPVGLIAVIGALRHDALKTVFAGQPMERWAISDLVIVVSQRVWRILQQ
jgi:hypothetical protein